MGGERQGRVEEGGMGQARRKRQGRTEGEGRMEGVQMRERAHVTTNV